MAETEAIIGNAQGLMFDMPQNTAYNPPITNVQIEKVENGFIIRVGCKTFASQSFTEVASGLELYYSDPKKAMEKFLKK